MYFWTAIPKTIAGRLDNTPVAAISPHLVPDTDKNSITDVGTVLALMLVKKLANTNSFQELIRQNMAVAVYPGRDKGRISSLNT